MASDNEPAVGIDLGTTFSVIAYLDEENRPVTLPNSEGDPTTASVVLFEDAGTVVGKEAVNAAPLEPESIADFPKRDMGNPQYSKAIGGQHFPPEVIQSLILEKLKRDAEAKIGPFTKAVITVPAFFNEPRRKATQDAGQMAGIEVLDIINEPTAAAILYGRQQGFLDESGVAKQVEKVLVYDLGGGTFDVTVMEIEGSNFRTVATGGDVQLGGIDWDLRLVDHVAEQFQAKFRGIDPRKNPSGMQRLMREAEAAKRALSAREKTTVSFEHGGEGVRVQITREAFESMTADLLQRTIFTTRSVLNQAGIEWKDLTRLLLVGGSTRIPSVRLALEETSGMSVDQTLSADEAVAHGAAVYAGILLASASGEYPQMTVQNVNSHSLGVLSTDSRTGRPRNAVLIPKNTPLPATKGKRFKTGKDGQRSVAVRVVEGGDSSGRGSTMIGKCSIKGMPTGLPKGTAVDVFFRYAADGRLTVRAKLPDLDREAMLTIERESGLDQDQLSEWTSRLKKTDGPLRFQA